MAVKQKFKSEFFDEETADKKVIKSLLTEISRLRGEESMAQVIKSHDGKFYVAGKFEEVNVRDIAERVMELQEELDSLMGIAPESLQEEINKIKVEQEAKRTADEAASQPIAESAPTDDQTQNNPAPADPTAGQPSQPADGADDNSSQPQTPEQPAPQEQAPDQGQVATPAPTDGAADPNPPAGEAPATPAAPTDESQPQAPILQ